MLPSVILGVWVFRGGGLSRYRGLGLVDGRWGAEGL